MSSGAARVLLRLLGAVLLLAAVAIGFALFHLRRRAEHQFAQPANAVEPLPPQTGTPSTITLLSANDTDGSLASSQVSAALPAEGTAKAKALLNRLIRSYAESGSLHPVGQSAGVDDVFLLPLPKAPEGGTSPQGTLAVVNLSASFADAHPSGIEPETMTLLSIIGTLHANMPEVAEVRFLVAGEPRATLAGHADLRSTYLAASTASPAPENQP